jgi:hypothetical protein
MSYNDNLATEINKVEKSNSAECLFGNNKNWENDDLYVIKTNINKRLSKELGLDELVYDVDVENPYEPPKEHGLNNCNMIIPEYYHLSSKTNNLFTINYYEIIKDDLRNLRPLNKYQLVYIKSLSNECKDELFDIFNSSLEALLSLT